MALIHTIKNIRDSIIQIGIRGQAMNGPLGTGFLVSEEGHAITAFHVIKAAQDLQQKQPQAAAVAMIAGPNIDTGPIHMRATFVGYGFEVIDQDLDNDIALLKLNITTISDLKGFTFGDKTLLAASAILDGNRPDEGEKIAISGYPLSEPSLVTTSGIVATSWAFSEDRQKDRYLGDITANPGNSGGPVYKERNGQVIGVLVGGKLTDSRTKEGLPVGINHSANISIIIPASAVIELLEKNSVAK